jgi:hypothetical protein
MDLWQIAKMFSASLPQYLKNSGRKNIILGASTDSGLFEWFEMQAYDWVAAQIKADFIDLLRNLGCWLAASISRSFFRIVTKCPLRVFNPYVPRS